MKPAYTHSALHVADLDASIAFYREFCGLDVVLEHSEGGDRTVWMAEAGREKELVFVLIGGGRRAPQAEHDFSHLGFALASREVVDAIAKRARAKGLLAWEPRDLPYPVGYFCGVRDPDGAFVEFSYGQPLGPGAESGTDDA